MLRRFTIALLLTAWAIPAFAQSPRIPLIDGLTIAYVGNDPGSASKPKGDFERLVVFSDVKPDGYQLAIQFTDYVSDEKLRNQKQITKNIRSVDMDSAHRVIFQFLEGDPPNFPGAVLLHASRAMLDELDKTGKTAFVFGNGPAGGGGFFSASSRKYYRGELTVMQANAALDVLLNGAKVSMPAIHVHGILTVADNTTEQDFWWSRDRDNPLLLRVQAKEGNWLQMVRADFPVTAPATPTPSTDSMVAQQLAGTACRAELHGIYFDTDSAFLLTNSQPALKEVAQALTSHADWKITIEGHTDTIGGDAYNLDLSQRRATAVRDALVKQFAIAADRLTANGLGETKPIDSNDTPVGRAHNRRVELARKC